MSILLAIVGLLGLAAGILLLVAPSTWQKLSEKANAILFSPDKTVTKVRPLVGIVLCLLSLYILWAAYTMPE
jgi:uncharacterized protein YjeT (DUF2065 family)